mmetsp:Transcript_165/g.315  ORF Transcript_165/g.315 Transcript_165/m.315 type:complete len:107 (-) Transcript_165:37-357(-)
MTTEVVRVYVDAKKSDFFPVKLSDVGEESGDGRLEADDLMSAEERAEAKERALRLASARPRLPPPDLQGLFETTLEELMGTAESWQVADSTKQTAARRDQCMCPIA